MKSVSLKSQIKNIKKALKKEHLYDDKELHYLKKSLRNFEGIYYQSLKDNFPSLDLHYFQSNIEGELIDKLHEIGFTYDGIILNAAAYTHTSVGIGDAVKAILSPVIEVHISNTYNREEFRHNSFISANAKGVILGFGYQSYKLALMSFL